MSGDATERKLEGRFETLHDRLMEQLDQARDVCEYTPEDESFKKSVTNYFGSTTYDAYIDWYYEGATQ